MIEFLKSQFKGYKYTDAFGYETVVYDVVVDNSKVIFKLDWEGVRVSCNLSGLISDGEKNKVEITGKFTPLIGKSYLDYRGNEFVIFKITKHMVCGLEFHCCGDADDDHIVDLDEFMEGFEKWIDYER